MNPIRIQHINENPKNYVIGFCDKYYTLYHVSNSDRLFVYEQNISMSLEETRRLFPTLSIYEDLNSKTFNWNAWNYNHGDFDGTLSRGKYKGTPVAQVVDFSYLVWYYENVNTPTKFEREAVKAQIMESGLYEYIEEYNFFRELPTKEEIEQKSRNIAYLTSGNAEVLMERNLDDRGYYFYNEIYLRFDNVKKMYYGEYGYCLPIINGKAKRVKGKSIIITKAERVEGNDSLIIVKEFKLAA